MHLRIERVQRRFTRYALSKTNYWNRFMPSYNVRCLLIGIQTLVLRRKFYSIMFVRDILSSRINCSFLLNEIHFRIPSRNFRVSFLFAERFHRTNYGCNEPLTRCIKEANSVCNVIDFFEICSRESFKNKLLLLLVNL